MHLFSSEGNFDQQMESPNSDFLMNFGGYNSPTGYRMKVGKKEQIVLNQNFWFIRAQRNPMMRVPIWSFRKSGTFQQKVLSNKETVKIAENRKLKMIKSISKISSFFKNWSTFEDFRPDASKETLGSIKLRRSIEGRFLIELKSPNWGVPS